jgi:hypothetical protein
MKEMYLMTEPWRWRKYLSYAYIIMTESKRENASGRMKEYDPRASGESRNDRKWLKWVEANERNDTSGLRVNKWDAMDLWQHTNSNQITVK